MKKALGTLFVITAVTCLLASMGCGGGSTSKSTNPSKNNENIKVVLVNCHGSNRDRSEKNVAVFLRYPQTINGEVRVSGTDSYSGDDQVCYFDGHWGGLAESLKWAGIDYEAVKRSLAPVTSHDEVIGYFLMENGGMDVKANPDTSNLMLVTENYSGVVKKIPIKSLL